MDIPRARMRRAFSGSRTYASGRRCRARRVEPRVYANLRTTIAITRCRLRTYEPLPEIGECTSGPTESPSDAAGGGSKLASDCWAGTSLAEEATEASRSHPGR
jgi:hypothetical protein